MADKTPYSLVSYRLMGDDLNPEIVTQMLGLTPDHTHFKGDIMPKSRTSTRYRSGMWGIRTTLPGEAPFTTQLHNLLDILYPKRLELVALSQQFDSDFYCSLFDENTFKIPPESLTRMADLGARFGVSIYGDPIESDSPNPNPRFAVSFRVQSKDLVPHEITQTLGVPPDDAFVRGSQGRIFGSWSIESKLDHEQPLVNHLECLSERVIPMQAHLSSLAAEHRLSFFCGLHSQRGQTGLELPVHVMKQIGIIGASIEVVLFSLAE